MGITPSPLARATCLVLRGEGYGPVLWWDAKRGIHATLEAVGIQSGAGDSAVVVCFEVKCLS